MIILFLQQKKKGLIIKKSMKMLYITVLQIAKKNVKQLVQFVEL